MTNTRPCGCCGLQLNETDRKGMMEFKGKMYSGNINDNIGIIQAEAIRYAAEKLRVAMTETGKKWLCNVDDLLDYARKVERGEETIDEQY